MTQYKPLSFTPVGRHARPVFRIDGSLCTGNPVLFWALCQSVTMPGLNRICGMQQTDEGIRACEESENFLCYAFDGEAAEEAWGAL